MTPIDEMSGASGSHGGSHGGSVRMYDPRVSRARDWILGVIGSLLVIVLGFCGKNLWDLNLTMRDVLKDGQTTVATLTDHELRLRQVERDVNTLAGKNLRGGPDVL
jgi:hypothetical protein